MPNREPIETTNLDTIYGSQPIPWRRPHELLAVGALGPDAHFFLGTVRPDGRPHAAGIGAAWFDGDLYFQTGPATRKARNIAANPACTISGSLPGMDLVFEGRGPARHRHADARGDRRDLPRGRLARAGGGRRVHGAVQRTERRPAAVAPLPTHGPHRVRRRRRRAARRNALAVLSAPPVALLRRDGFARRGIHVTVVALIFLETPRWSASSSMANWCRSPAGWRPNKAMPRWSRSSC